MSFSPVEVFVLSEVSIARVRCFCYSSSEKGHIYSVCAYSKRNLLEKDSYPIACIHPMEDVHDVYSKSGLLDLH